MRVINYGDCRVDVGLCNLRCPYCVHLEHELRDVSPDEIASSLKGCESVYIGGAEPTVHADLAKLLEKLKENGSYITLKTNGYLPSKIEEVLHYVDRFVFEIKGDFNDIDTVAFMSGLSRERARKYISNLEKSLEIARKGGKTIRLWFRIIPGYVDEKRFTRMLEKVGIVDEILLYQFLSRPDWDKPVEGLEKPDYKFVRKLGAIAKQYAGRVIIIGDRRESI
ncbi:radical SAM protein [Geoglobus acetivorans]|uniref:radical SAM protein n=1 Tax=Geoglobus acetivorans TaxID=565033 RepID=UPI00064EC024